MSGINVGRLILGGLAAGVVMFLADGFIHEKIPTGFYGPRRGLRQ